MKKIIISTIIIMTISACTGNTDTNEDNSSLIDSAPTVDEPDTNF